MERVPCPISNSKEFTPYLKVPDRFDRSGKAEWNLVRSSTSGLIMLNPRPDSAEIGRHYPGARYDPYRNSSNSSSFKERAYLAARTLLLGYRAGIILKGWEKPMEECAVLEIGCSTGDLLHYFRRKGVPIKNLAGIEPDADTARYAREVFGLNIFPSIAEVSAERKKFDRIVLWHTLEHIHAINETLHEVAEQLKPDGVLVIALPNPASFDAEHFKENWVAWDAPRHLYHFWPGTLEKLLGLHGLCVFKQRAYLPDAVYNILHSEGLRCSRQGGELVLSAESRVLSEESENSWQSAVGSRQGGELVLSAEGRVLSAFGILRLLGRGGVDALRGGARASSVVYYAERKG